MKLPNPPKGCISKLPLPLIAVWTVILLVVYLFIVNHSSTPVIDGPHTPTHMLDAVVYIAMGGLSSDPIVDYSIASVRKLGNWEGKIYIITDSPSCFEGTSKQYDVKLLSVPSVRSLMEIKAMKAKLFDIIPDDHNNGILYLDVDIVVRQSFESFYRDLSDMMSHRILLAQQANTSSSMVHSKANHTSLFDFAAFPDAKGHFVGFCSGCEKWHTGVIYMRRNYGGSCLKAWENILLSGQYGTDQESLDEAERSGQCPHAVTLPPKHLLFAKDYIGMMLASGQTFIHFTSAVRLGTQDAFYRTLIVPKLRRSLDPPLSASIMKEKKVCVIANSTTV